eukprot:jgi/Botrbrau1/3510/Bobra.341_2s0039.1
MRMADAKKQRATCPENPDLSTWLQLLQARGLTSQLDNPTVSVTMFAPVNEAFTDPVLLGTRFNAANITDLLAANPSAVAPVVGYHLVKGVYAPASLLPGTVLNTTATLKEFNSTDRVLSLTILSPSQVKGIGSTATILRPGVVTCGPQVVYVIDSVLIPFTLQDPSGDPVSNAPPSLTIGSATRPTLGG